MGKEASAKVRVAQATLSSLWMNPRRHYTNRESESRRYAAVLTLSDLNLPSILRRVNGMADTLLGLDATHIHFSIEQSGNEIRLIAKGTRKRGANGR